MFRIHTLQGVAVAAVDESEEVEKGQVVVQQRHLLPVEVEA